MREFLHSLVDREHDSPNHICRYNLPDNMATRPKLASPEQYTHTLDADEAAKQSPHLSPADPTDKLESSWSLQREL
jgi:hypothetical protein